MKKGRASLPLKSIKTDLSVEMIDRSGFSGSVNSLKYLSDNEGFLGLGERLFAFSYRLYPESFLALCRVFLRSAFEEGGGACIK